MAKYLFTLQAEGQGNDQASAAANIDFSTVKIVSAVEEKDLNPLGLVLGKMYDKTDDGRYIENPNGRYRAIQLPPMLGGMVAAMDTQAFSKHVTGTM